MKHKKEEEYTDITSFLQSLYHLCINPRYHSIISFYEKGGFVIKNKERFLEICDFITTYSSFLRQLSNYHFVKVSSRNDTCIIYQNDFFTPNMDCLHKLSNIQYVERKAKGAKRIKEENSIEEGASLLLCLKYKKVKL